MGSLVVRVKTRARQCREESLQHAIRRLSAFAAVLSLFLPQPGGPVALEPYVFLDLCLCLYCSPCLEFQAGQSLPVVNLCPFKLKAQTHLVP